MVKKYRKKPVVIEATKFLGEPIPDFELRMITVSGTHPPCKECKSEMHRHGNVKTLEGFHIACPGDFIIRGIKGEHYPCKPDIFEMTYEKVEE